MAWDEDTLRLEVAVLFQHLDVGWDSRCERYLAYHRLQEREDTHARRRVCPKCGGLMHHGAEQCARCFARTKLPYKRCSQCRGKRDHKDWSRCLPCDVGDRLTMKWMKRDTLRERLLRGLALRRCNHGARRMTVSPDETPVACVECILDVMTSPMAEKSDKIQVAEPETNGFASDEPTSWYHWRISHETCHCGSSFRHHPDGKRLICVQGHVKVT